MRLSLPLITLMISARGFYELLKKYQPVELEKVISVLEACLRRQAQTTEQVLAQLGFQETTRLGNQLHRPCLVHRSEEKRHGTLNQRVRRAKRKAKQLDCPSKQGHLALRFRDIEWTS